MGTADRLASALIGAREGLPLPFLERYPQLASIRLRRGGLPPRIGGWCLGRRTVEAVTLWHTVWLDRRTRVTEELLLHEFWHVQQFEADRAFPLRYIWESVARGYYRNRFEADARSYARANVEQGRAVSPSEDE